MLDQKLTIDSGTDTGSHDVEQNPQQTNKCDGGGNCGNSASSTITIENSRSRSPSSSDTSAG